MTADQIASPFYQAYAESQDYKRLQTQEVPAVVGDHQAVAAPSMPLQRPQASSDLDLFREKV